MRYRADLRRLLADAERKTELGDRQGARALFDQARALVDCQGTRSVLAAEVRFAEGHRDRAAGDVAAAKSAFEETIEILDSLALDEEHATIRVQAGHALGALHRQQGNYRAAEEQLTTALTVAYECLEHDSPDLACVLNELGVTYKYSGKFTEATELYTRALRILTDRLGPDHPFVATIYHNLGGLAHARGEYSAAEPLARRAVEIRERALAADHPDVAADRAALAPILDALGKYDEAKGLLIELLKTYTKDQNYYEMAVTLNNLGSIAYRQQDLIGARAMLGRALSLKEEVLGTKHPELAPTLNNLGLIHQTLGEVTDARALYARAIGILERTVEPDHPTLAACRTKLANCKNGRKVGVEDHRNEDNRHPD